MMTDSGIWLGEAVGRLMRRSVVRSWSRARAYQGTETPYTPCQAAGFKDSK